MVLKPDEAVPTLVSQDIAGDQNRGPVLENNLILFTLTFSEGMDASTVAALAFSNAGKAPVL